MCCGPQSWETSRSMCTFSVIYYWETTRETVREAVRKKQPEKRSNQSSSQRNNFRPSPLHHCSRSALETFYLQLEHHTSLCRWYQLLQTYPFAWRSHGEMWIWFLFGWGPVVWSWTLARPSLQWFHVRDFLGVREWCSNWASLCISLSWGHDLEWSQLHGLCISAVRPSVW